LGFMLLGFLASSTILISADIFSIPLNFIK
jgi:hypothetical protein